MKTNTPTRETYMAVRTLVKGLSKERTLRDRIRELRWRRAKRDGNVVKVETMFRTCPFEQTR